MTNEQLLDDLKQLLDVRLSQTEATLRAEIKASSDAIRSDLGKQIADVNAKLDTVLESQGEINHDVETRLTRLEQSAA